MNERDLYRASVTEALHDFLTAPDWDETYHIFEQQHALLSSDDALLILQNMVEDQLEHGKLNLVKETEHYLSLLEDARQLGVELSWEHFMQKLEEALQREADAILGTFLAIDDLDELREMLATHLDMLVLALPSLQALIARLLDIGANKHANYLAIYYHLIHDTKTQAPDDAWQRFEENHDTAYQSALTEAMYTFLLAENWNDLQHRLITHKELLLSDTALLLLQNRIAEIQATGGETALIDTAETYLAILTDAYEHGIEVAWQHLLTQQQQVSVAVQAMITALYQGDSQRVLEEQREILLSPMTFMFLHTGISSNIMPILIDPLKQVLHILNENRIGGPRELHDVKHEEAGSEEQRSLLNDFIQKQGMSPIDLNDPQNRQLVQEIMSLTPEQHAVLQPLMAETFHIQGMNYDELQEAIPHLQELFKQAFALITYEEKPQIWTWLQASWSSFSSDDSQGDTSLSIGADRLEDMHTRSPYKWGMVMFARGTSAMRRTHGDRRDHIEQALSDFSAALTIFTQTTYPLEWAKLMSGFGFAYCSRIAGDSKENMKQAIAHFDAALTAISRENEAALWAITHMGCGMSLLQLVELTGNRGEPLEQVIQHCTAALEVFTMQTDPTSWGNVIATRGRAYAQRYAGGQEENLAFALADLNAALMVTGRERMPEDWATYLRMRGLVYLRLVGGDREKNTEQALRDFTDALTIFTYDDYRLEWASVIVGRGMAYQQRQTGDRGHNEALALADLDDALAVFSKEEHPSSWSKTLAARGNLYLLRIGGDKKHNLEQAIDDYTAALTVFIGLNDPVVGSIYVNRGMARRHLAFINGYDIQRNMSSFSALFERVFVQQEGPDFLAALYQQLIGERQRQCKEAIADLETALSLLTIESAPQEWATAHRELATSYIFIIPGAADFEQIATSAKHMWALLKGQAALDEQFTFSAEQVMGTMQRFQAERKQHTDKALSCYKEALRVFTQQSMPFEWAMTLNSRGALYLLRVQDGHLEDANQALDDYEHCLSVFTREAAPIYFRGIQYSRACIFVKLQRWAQAHLALVRVREVQRDLVISAQRSKSQAELIAEFAPLNIYLRDAQVLLHLDPPALDKAVLALEEGRAQTMRSALDLDAIDPQNISAPEARLRAENFLLTRDTWLQLQQHMTALLQSGTAEQRDQYTDQFNQAFHAFTLARDDIRRYDDPDFMTPAPTKNSIAHAINTPQTALVYLAAGLLDGDDYGMALIVTQGPTNELVVHHKRLPALTREAVTNLLETDTTQTIPIRVKRAVETLGEMGLNTLAEMLVALRIQTVRLIPYGWLGLFPLPAAFISLPGQRKQTFGDIFEVTFVPSARAADIVHHRVQQTPSSAPVELLLAGNPQPRRVGVRDLPYADAEAEAIYCIANKHKYPPRTTHYLTPHEAKKERVVTLLQRANYAHLAIHGKYMVENPLSSHLLLARGEVIQLRETLNGEINLKGLRLFVLSACETSVIDIRRSPDEVVGLAAGFLQAGAAGVMASLWQIADDASYLLMTRFADLYLDPTRNLTPARALAQAQHWLREQATHRVLADYEPDYLSVSLAGGLRNVARERLTMIREKAAKHSHEGADTLPYADPSDWAAFVVTGC